MPHLHPTPWRLLATLSVLALLAAAPARSQPAAPASAPASAPVPPEAFFSRTEIARPVLSPSGRYLAYLRKLPAGFNVLVVQDLQDTRQLVPLVRHSDADIYGVRWVGEDHLVYSVTDDEAGTGLPEFAPGLFTVARTGGLARQLVKTRRPFIVDGTLAGRDRRLEYNHALLWVPQDGSGDVIVGEWDRGAGDLTTYTPRRLNIQTLQTRSIPHTSLGGVNGWLFDSAGEPRVAVIESGGRVRVQWRDAGSSEWRLLMDASRMEVPWEPYGVDATGNLYVTRAAGKDGTLVLARYDFAKGQPATNPSVEVPGFDFRGSLVAEQPGGRTLGVRALTDGEITVWSDPGMKALQEQIDQRLPDRVNRLSCRQCDSASRTVLVESWSDRDPGSYYVWLGDKKQLLLLGRALPAIAPERMATMDFARIRARDGRSLPVWLTVPRRAPGSPPPPAVVLVHGGPMVRGVTWQWRDMPQFLASRGYVVIEPEFRGSDGYGTDHLRAGWKQWGQAMQDDIADALLWATAQGHADGKRACIMGGSYGGYATLMGLVRHPQLYRCGIAAAAVTDLVRMVEGSWWWRDDIADEGRRYDLPVIVGDARTDAAMLRENSPVLQAARIKAPVLLVHGEQDQRVPLVHARDMRKALRDAGNEPEWLVFGDEGHGWGRTENRVAYAKRVEQFLARHLLKDQGAPTTR